MLHWAGEPEQRHLQGVAGFLAYKYAKLRHGVVGVLQEGIDEASGRWGRVAPAGTFLQADGYPSGTYGVTSDEAFLVGRALSLDGSQLADSLVILKILRRGHHCQRNLNLLQATVNNPKSTTA